MPDFDILQQLGGVLFVFALLAAIVYLFGKRGSAPLLRLSRRNTPELMESLDRLHLSHQHSIHMVRAGKRVLLIGVHPGGCTLLDASDSPGAAEGQNNR